MLNSAPKQAAHSIGLRPAPVDHNLHGLIGVRLIGASVEDAAAVARQLGPTRGSLSGAPDITIRFVDPGTSRRPMRLLGAHEAGFSEDGFFVLRSKHKAAARVRIPFDRIGRDLEIVCERGLSAVPLLVPIINLTLLSKGIAAIHASAFVHNDMGIMTTGWSKGGKTEALLAFASKGGKYIGDEWVYVTPDGRMYGISEPVRVWDWQLASLPNLREHFRRSDRCRLKLKQMVYAATKLLARCGRSLPPLRVVERVLPLIARQLFVDVPAERLFPNARTAQGAKLERLFFVASHEGKSVELRPIEPADVARRMVHSLAEERARFMSYYHMFRFAFPALSNPLIEDASRLERDILMQVLDDRPAYEVLHPYPMNVPDLYDAMRPACERGASNGRSVHSAVPVEVASG